MNRHRTGFQRVDVISLLNRYIVGPMSLDHKNFQGFLDFDYFQHSLRWHPIFLGGGTGAKQLKSVTKM